MNDQYTNIAIDLGPMKALTTALEDAVKALATSAKSLSESGKTLMQVDVDERHAFLIEATKVRGLVIGITQECKVVDTGLNKVFMYGPIPDNLGASAGTSDPIEAMLGLLDKGKVDDPTYN